MLRRLAFIRAARNVGLSLDEIAAALETLPDEPNPDPRRLDQAVEGMAGATG